MKNQILERTPHSERRKPFEAFVFFVKMKEGCYRFIDKVITNKSLFNDDYRKFWKKSLDGRGGIIDKHKNHHRDKGYWSKSISIFIQNRLFDAICQDMLDHNFVMIDKDLYLKVEELKSPRYIIGQKFIRPMVKRDKDKYQYPYRIKFLGKFRKQFNERIYTNKEIY